MRFWKRKGCGHTCAKCAEADQTGRSLDALTERIAHLDSKVAWGHYHYLSGLGGEHAKQVRHLLDIYYGITERYLLRGCSSCGRLPTGASDTFALLKTAGQRLALCDACHSYVAREWRAQYDEIAANSAKAAWFERKRDEPASVYVMACAGRVKVGLSRVPEGRRRDIQQSSPEPVALCKSWQVSSRTLAHSVERKAHDILSAFRASGEWFDVDEATAIAAVERAMASEGVA